MKFCAIFEKKTLRFQICFTQTHKDFNFHSKTKICDIKIFYNSFETNFAKSEKAFFKEEFVKTFLRRLSHRFVAYEIIKTLLRKLSYGFIRVIVKSKSAKKVIIKSKSESESEHYCQILDNQEFFDNQQWTIQSKNSL